MKSNLPTIKKELPTIVKNALALEIETKMDLDTGGEILSKLNQFKDSITTEKERITRPLLDALKVERGRWKPLEKMYSEGIDHIRGQMSDYMMEQSKKEAKVAEKVAKGEIDMDEALVKLGVEEDKIVTESGSVSFRESQVLKITDEYAIPREYLIINEKQVLDALKAGEVVPGAEIELKAIPINYR